MSIGLDSGAAPSFVGPTPPDRVEMTFGEHLNAALQLLITRDLTDQEMREFKAFIVGVDSVVREKVGQQQQGQQQQGGGAAQSAGQLPAGTEDFGAGVGEPKQLGI